MIQEYFLLFLVIIPVMFTWFILDVVRKLSIKLRIFAIPNERSSHTRIIPTTGGVALSLSWILFIFFYSNLTYDLSDSGPNSVYIYCTAGILMCIVGFYDDLKQIPSFLKLLLQIAIFFIITIPENSLINSFYGILGVYELNEFQSILFSGFVFIVIVNAINLVDGIDGLSASLSLFFMIISSYIFYISGKDYYLLTVAFSFSLLVFIIFNISDKRKIFLGDTGSLGLGISIAIISLGFLNTNVNYSTFLPINAALFIVLILAYPLLDVIRVFVLRIYNKKSPLRADRNHIHHKIIDIGYSHIHAVFLIITFQIILLLINLFLIQNIGLHYQILLNIIIIGFILFFLYKTPNKSVS